MTTKGKIDAVVSGQHLMTEPEWKLTTRRIIHRAIPKMPDSFWFYVVMLSFSMNSKTSPSNGLKQVNLKYESHIHMCETKSGRHLGNRFEIACHKYHQCVAKYAIELSIFRAYPDDDRTTYLLRGLLHMHTDNYGTIILPI